MALKRILIFGISIAITLFVVSLFGISETISALLKTRLDILLVCLLLQILVIFLPVVRIKILAWKQGFLSNLYAIRLTLAGVFVSNITPLAKMGGEPLKMYMLGKNIGNYHSTAAIAIESLVELMSSYVALLFVAIFFFGSIPAGFITLFLAVLVFLTIGIFFFAKLLTSPRLLFRIYNWVVKKIERFYPLDQKDHMTLFHSAMKTMMKRKGIVVGAFSISVITKIIEIIRFWLVFYALGLSMPFTHAVIVWTLLLVVAFIPWLPGSLGLIEISGISTLLVLGIPQSIAASGIVLDRLLSLWLPLVVGFIALNWAKKRGELPSLSSWKKNKF